MATSGEYRVEVGMSRVAESLLVAFEQLKEPVYAECHYRETAECNAGGGGEVGAYMVGCGQRIQAAGGGDDVRFQHGPRKSRSIKHTERRGAKSRSTCRSSERSPRLTRWCRHTSSSCARCSWCFYAASVNERVARAWVKRTPASERDAVSAAQARSSSGSK